MTDDESLQQAIDEAVSLRPYDRNWPVLFETERQRLMALFPGLLLDVQHFGSTAVEGMTAKPIIDILAGVASMAVADSLVDPLTRSGYTTSAEFNATLSDRRWLMRHAQGRRTHHLHLVVLGEAVWRQRLRFRDALRADPKLADRYLALKSRLALQHAEDRELYTQAKTEFVAAVSRDL
ncbi:GrpB family protein [Paucibacter sp. XJ19-41]|uniref:GrpB family protein n=1 Tax=Paucibacter sp. XJ19-41 TaxID=2927824 RepID=UPI00234AC27D|nr:GrpB family protein [Paucibacter sp. XJ19-41]MDC6170499.1 GrpB family protein [Paucibacter sp. XJ19-41]